MPTKEALVPRALDNATKDRPWLNSSGMKFVPVVGTHHLEHFLDFFGTERWRLAFGAREFGRFNLPGRIN